MELKQLEEQRRAEEEQRAREKADADAVERWKAKEAERANKERRERERADREYRQRMQEHLLASGVPEDQIQAILEKKRISANNGSASPAPQQQQFPQQQLMQPMQPMQPPPVGAEMMAQNNKATYTRMARRHLSLETLRVKGIEYDLDVVSPHPIQPAHTRSPVG